MLEPGKVLGERYEIIKKVGAGGMSIVYLAKCNKLQRYVAIKVLRSEFAKDEAFVKKFRAEAFSAGSLSHPNIVGIYDVGVEEDLHYIVMEYIEGQTLKEVIEEQGCLPSNVALEYGAQIVSALRHAHKKQIIHRDIKPQNILVTHDNVLKVADFGIARAVNSSTIVATGNAIGSVHYFSPEQAKGKYVNETSDLYSCGIVMFEMATGRLPFQAESHVSVALKHINEEIPKPSQFTPDLWAGLEQIILKATNKKQELRYQNADAMLEDIKKVLANPYAVIDMPLEEGIDQTILLTDVQTNYIRQNDKQTNHLETSQIGGREMNMPEDFYDEEDDDNDEEVSMLYKVLVSVGGVLATLVIVGIIAFAAFFLMPSWNAPKYTAVPNVLGKTVDVAKKEAKDSKLTIQVIGEEPKSDVTPGTIISQEPVKEELVEPGTVIEVVVAVEKQVVTKKVPDVMGINVGDAREQLEKVGFIVIQERDYSNEFEMGKVMGQTPKAGEMLEEGEVVTLVVSNGPKVELVKVPNLVGSMQEDAKLTLMNNGLKLGKVNPKEHETVPKGQVIYQSAQAGTEVEKGTAIDIDVSTGPAVTIPEEGEGTEGEEITGGETTPGGNEQSSGETTITHIINDPGLGKDEYHVLVMLDNAEGSKLVFDKQVKKAQFPLPIQVSGKGKGTLTTFFDGQEQYKDEIVFNEVTQ